MSCFLRGKTLREAAHSSISFSCIHCQPHPAMVSWTYAIMMHLSDILITKIFFHIRICGIHKKIHSETTSKPLRPHSQNNHCWSGVFSSSIFSMYVFFYIIGWTLHILHFYILHLVFSNILWPFSGIFLKILQKYCSNWW